MYLTYRDIMYSDSQGCLYVLIVNEKWQLNTCNLFCLVKLFVIGIGELNIVQVAMNLYKIMLSWIFLLHITLLIDYPLLWTCFMTCFIKSRMHLLKIFQKCFNNSIQLRPLSRVNVFSVDTTCDYCNLSEIVSLS